MISSIIELLIYHLSNIPIFLKLKKCPVSLRCLSGKIAIVTGGNAGIGFAVATKLASRGCKVIIADCQNGERSREQIVAATDNTNIVYKYLDLSSLKSVRSFATDICRTEEKIDILVNNAGIGITENIVSEDGLNYLMQVNIFGAFLLTHLLLDPMKKSGSAQVIFTSSVAAFAHSLTLKRLNPINFKMNNDYRISLYSNSKLCSILAAQEFAKRLKKYGISVNSIDPTVVRTQIFNTLENFKHVLRTLLKISLFLLGRDAIEVANSHLYVVTRMGNDIPTGENYLLFQIARKPKILKNRKLCEDIWSKLEDLVELKSEEKISC